MEELEQSAKQIKMNADLLEGLSQGKLAQLFQEKRKARKAYQEEHSKIAAKFNNVSNIINQSLQIGRSRSCAALRCKNVKEVGCGAGHVWVGIHEWRKTAT